jgi:hypothetical protein
MSRFFSFLFGFNYADTVITLAVPLAKLSHLLVCISFLSREGRQAEADKLDRVQGHCPSLKCFFLSSSSFF